MPTAPPAGWYVDPDGSVGRRYWDGIAWTTHRRSDRGRRPSGPNRWWRGLPVALRAVLIVVVLLALAGVGFAFFGIPTPDQWTGLPARLNCRQQDGPTPPRSVSVSSVEVRHPRGDVLQLVVRFAEPLPPAPTATPAGRLVGYVLKYSVANVAGNRATKFAEVNPEQGTEDLAVISTLAANPAESRMRPDRDTNARQTAPDAMQILLDVNRLGVDNQAVRPELTVEAQFNTPSTTTVQFAAQVCRA